MNYPLWEVPLLGGGIVIALIAIVHVFIAHFAVGGGLFLVLTERKCLREGSPELYDYLKRHSRFFILLTLVFGAVSGVGIWFAIGLAHPSGTSLLIQNFVWGWAIEWCLFFIEIAAALVYYYGWDRIRPEIHQRIGWIYFASAYLSLVVINGILSFMLTPGRWLETGRFWDGFFNPSYLPSLLLRSGVALALTGLYALLTASFIDREPLRTRMVRYATKWVFAGFVLIPPSGLWFLFAIPEEARAIALGGAPAVLIFLILSLTLSVFLLFFAWWAGWSRPGRMNPALATVFLVAGFAVTATSEWVREAVRKPYIVSRVMYSNSILVEEARTISQRGFLPAARWSPIRGATPQNRLAAGREIFRFQCSPCHTIDGYNAVRPLIRGWRESFLREQIRNLDELKGFMPPFVGTEEERRALAHYLASLWGFPAENQPVPIHEAGR